MRGPLLLLALLAAGTPAHAFRLPNPSGAKPPHDSPMILHWDMRVLPGCRLPWSSCGPGTTDLALTSEFAVIPAAFTAWDADACGVLSFTQKPALPPTCQLNVGDKWNLVYWEDRPEWFSVVGFTSGSPPDGSGNIVVGTPAWTLVWYTSPSGVISNADVVLNGTANRNFTWVNAADGAAVNWKTPGFYGPPGAFQADVRTVVTHEAGHFLGLEHNAVSGSIMNIEEILASGQARHAHNDDDRDGKSFLYCMDLGDAPDPCAAIDGEYPSHVHYVGIGDSLNGIRLDGIRHGAAHLFGIRPRQQDRNYTYEWMGGAPWATSSDMTAECDPRLVDRDSDDGVSFVPDPPIAGKPVKVRVHVRSARDAEGERHDYFGDDTLWVNGWVDRNRDCFWSPATEHFLHDFVDPELPAGPNVVVGYRVEGEFTMPGGGSEAAPLPVWLRLRLDWREDSGARALGHWDPGLTGVYGAAQFGEVEDYRLSCYDSYKNRWARNSTGVARSGLAMVTAGDASVGGASWAARVTARDCVLSPITPGGIGLTYDALRDETTLEARPDTPVAPEEWIHVGRSQADASHSNPPLGELRAYWVPASGAPSALDWIPGTHAGLEPETPERPAMVRIGCADEGTGGVLRSDPAGNFADSMDVTVSWRISPLPVPLPNLSACDPLIRKLPESFVGSARITPESPMVFPLPPVQRGESLILGVHSAWSVNGNVGDELIEFVDPLSQFVAVPPRYAPREPGPSASPNPFAARTRITFAQPVSGPAAVTVFDLAGARVRTLAAGSWAPAGPRTLEWDGRDERGTRVPAGVYFVRIRVGAREASLRIVRAN